MRNLLDEIDPFYGLALQIVNREGSNRAFHRTNDFIRRATGDRAKARQ